MDRNREIFDEVQAQMTSDARKNAEYFKRMNQRIRENRKFVSNMRALKRQNDAIWEQLGLDFDECRRARKNPFLSLADQYPKIFSEMQNWAEKSRKEARKEAAAYGFDLQKIEHVEVNQKFFRGATSGTASSSKPKKLIRRVRI